MSTESDVSVTSVVTVSWNSSARYEHLFDNIVGKAVGAVQFVVVDNTNGRDEQLSEFAARRSNTVVVPNEGNGLQPSVAHASGLEAGVEAVGTEHLLIVDPDVHIFLQGWDAHCADLVQGDVVAAGAPYPFWKLGKYHDFPSPIFCFANARALREMGADFYPFYESPVQRAYSFVARKIVRLGPVGTKHRISRWPLVRRVTHTLERALPLSAPDTGWKVARAARLRGARSVCFDAAAPLDVRALPAADPALLTLAADYELFLHDGVPVLTHQYSTGSFHWRTPHGADAARWLECIAAAEARTVTSSEKATRAP